MVEVMSMTKTSLTCRLSVVHFSIIVMFLKRIIFIFCAFKLYFCVFTNIF